MPRVLVADKLETAGLDLMRQAGIELDIPASPLKGADLHAALQKADGVIVRSETKITAADLEKPGKLRVIVRAGVGVDTIDVPAATRRGILVMNTPDANTVSTAEQTIALLMALARHIPAGDAHVKAAPAKWDRKKFLGAQLTGKTIGVIGVGRIGRAVAKRAAGLEMKVIGYDPFLSPSAVAQLGIEAAADLDSLLPKCDFLTVHTPLSEATRDLIGAKQMAMLPKGARIINCARGGIYNEQALAEALTSGHLAGAAIDVFVKEPPPADLALLKAPNLVCTPHLGASTVEAQESVAREAAVLISDYLLKNVVGGGAVNTAAIDRGEMDEMRLYVDLGRRLGLLLAQLAPGAIEKVQVLYRGDAAKRPTKLITSSIAAGLLESRLDQCVNNVNARVLAEERGIEIVEQSSSQKSDFSTMVRVDVTAGGKKLTAAGTLFGNQYLRLVQLEEYLLDAYLDGVMLLFEHRDVPGLIGYIGTIFGKHGVNIAQMTVGRQTPGGNAIAVLNLDSPPPEEALREVRSHEKISNVSVAQLPPAGQMPPWFG